MPDSEYPDTTGHQSPEYRLQQSEPIATFEDLEGLDTDALYALASECPVEPADPDSCVLCKAFVLWQDKFDEQLARENDLGTPRLDDLVSETPVFEQDETPVAERFAKAVRDLDDLVQEMLTGPPIPPPNVTLEDLAALMLGAEKWSHLIDAQGLELAPGPAAIKAEVDRVVAKMRRNNR